MSIFSYFWQAGFVVKSVMFILFIASIYSWTLIIQRACFFRSLKKQYSKFYNKFWQSQDLVTLFEGELDESSVSNSLSRIFKSGFKEFLRQEKNQNINLERIEQSMNIQHAKEMEELEKHLSVFASIGSIAPYVGLFGTVWGIMTSFQALGHAQQATIAMVAPGISEALVATALGLFTAIPAVIAFNRYTLKSNFLLNRFELFQEELVALIAEQMDVVAHEKAHA